MLPGIGESQPGRHPDPARVAVRQPLAFTTVLLSCRGYLITAPSVFRSGVEEVISVTIFNSPREVMVQAQLVAQGEAVAWSQGTILGRSPGCLMGASSPSAQRSLLLALRAWAGWALLGFLPSHLPRALAGREGRLSSPHFSDEESRASVGQPSPGSMGAAMDGVRHLFMSALARGGTGTISDLFLSFDHRPPPTPCSRWC